MAVEAPATANYAYLFTWEDFYAPRLAYYLMDQGLRLKVTTEPSQIAGRITQRVPYLSAYKIRTVLPPKPYTTPLHRARNYRTFLFTGYQRG
ncbi:MAG: hypothetical protein R2795_22945 [Saprospiraceae bacterium]